MSPTQTPAREPARRRPTANAFAALARKRPAEPMTAEARARAEVARLVAEQGMPNCSFGVLAAQSAIWPDITLLWVHLRSDAEVDQWAELLGLKVESATTYRDDQRDGLRHYLRTYKATADRWIPGAHVIFEGSRSHVPPAWTAQAVKS